MAPLTPDDARCGLGHDQGARGHHRGHEGEGDHGAEQVRWRDGGVPARPYCPEMSRSC
jgi:hypothetical protein